MKTYSTDELNTLLNSWPDNTRGHVFERTVIGVLDTIGRQIGYGALEDLAHGLYLIQCNNDIKEVANFKQKRFKSLNWPLPPNFEEVAKQ
jgi:hypothetical protein